MSEEKDTAITALIIAMEARKQTAISIIELKVYEKKLLEAKEHE